MPNIKFTLLSLTKKMWPKVTAYALAGIAGALIALVFKDHIPRELSKVVNHETLNNILTILASSMLAVTTFSLSTMVSAYSAATSNVTPRATSLITADKTTQNALSTFLGTFLFSLVGLITLNMGIYEGSGRVILLFLTLAVIALTIVMLIRWIERLTSLGRVSETSMLVEKEAVQALTRRAQKPTLGCNRLEDLPKELRENNKLLAPSTGYVQFVDIETLGKLTEEHDINVYIIAMTGRYVMEGGDLAVLSRPLEKEDMETVTNCFTVGPERSFDQDPRYGVCVLAEIGSRAASQAVNDSGTIIDVLGRLGRVLELYAKEKSKSEEVEYSRIWFPELQAQDLFQDAFSAIIRDSASLFEVQSRVLKILAGLALLNEDYHRSAIVYSQLALRYADANLFLPEEKESLKSLARPLVKGQPQ